MLARAAAHRSAWPAATPAALRVAARCLALGVYAAVLLPRIPDLAHAVFLGADAPATAYLGAGADGGLTLLGLHAEVGPVLLSGWLLNTPVAHLAVQLVGPVLWLLAVATICIAVRRTGGAWTVTAVSGGCASITVLATVLNPSGHVLALSGTALLSLGVVWLARGRLRARGGIGLALVSAACLAGDVGFLAAGLVPFVAACLYLERFTTQRHALRAAVAIVIGAVVTTVGGLYIANIAGIHLLSFEAASPPLLERVVRGAPAALQTLGGIAGGLWRPSNPGGAGTAAAVIAGAGIMCIAPAATLVQARRRAAPARIAFCLFWAVSGVLVLSAYIALGAALTSGNERYLIPCVVSAVATLPFIAASQERSWLPHAGASVMAVAAAAGIALVPATEVAGSHAPLNGQRILAVLSSHGLSRGYADYWTAAPLTWMSNEAVRVYPVEAHCTAAAMSLCTYPFAAHAWYRPGPGPTFLIVRSGFACLDAAPTGSGGPDTVLHVDAATTIYVYGYDIATRLASPANGGCFAPS